MDNPNTISDDALLVSKHKWISFYDDAREKRVSDWPVADHCAICGRKIVHVFTVGNFNYGSECVRTAIEKYYGIAVGEKTKARDLVGVTVGEWNKRRERFKREHSAKRFFARLGR